MGLYKVLEQEQGRRLVASRGTDCVAASTSTVGFFVETYGIMQRICVFQSTKSIAQRAVYAAVWSGQLSRQNVYDGRALDPLLTTCPHVIYPRFVLSPRSSLLGITRRGVSFRQYTPHRAPTDLLSLAIRFHSCTGCISHT